MQPVTMTEHDTDRDDRHLAALAAAGDRDAFAHLLERHYDRIFRMAYSLCGHRQEAEDVTQDLCIRLARDIGHYRGEARFTTWLYRLVVNACHDQYRRNRKRKGHLAYDELTLRDPGHTPEQAMQARQQIKAIGHLSEKLRIAVILVHWHGLNHAEAAKILHISEGTLSWRLHEARRLLGAADKIATGGHR